MMKRKRSYTSWIWMPIIFMISNTKFCSNICAIYYNNTISNAYKYFLFPTGWAMSQSLPTDGFRCLNNDEIQELFTKLKDVPEDGARDTSLKWILRFHSTNMITLTNMFLHQNIWKSQKIC